MVDTPEVPHQPHPAHTGHNWLDIALGLSAMFVSVVSLVIAIAHGRTMERMAEANTRMVQASSWPFVAFSTHNVDARGNPNVRLVLTNEGVGPARIETFELWWDGKPMASLQALLEACCANTLRPDPQHKTMVISQGLTAPSILRSGEHTDFVGIADSQPGALWNAFNVERDKITVRVCYCSVFDECWRGSGVTTKADPVKSCPAPEVPYKVD